MSQKNTQLDPKGLIRDCYKIDGIRPEECRSVFLDWAISQADGLNVQDMLCQLITQYADPLPLHPMSVVLYEATAEPKPVKRRGGRQGRLQS